MEAQARIQDLRKVSQTFFDKSIICTKVTDVQAFFALAQQASAQADALEADIKIESCWTYLHFIKYFDYSPSYEAYMEFCVRNRLAPVSNVDLETALGFLEGV